jgi:hypothetical protein
VAGARCVKHPDAHVVAQRTYDTGSGRRRQYRCTPAVGEQHWFSVIITDGSAPAASWAPPPVCAVHPASRVIRFGTYGKTTGKPRQRYRCFPEDGSTVHTFTPPLPASTSTKGTSSATTATSCINETVRIKTVEDRSAGSRRCRSELFRRVSCACAATRAELPRQSVQRTGL